MDDISLKQTYAVICGRRNCGKSVLLRYLYEMKRHEFNKIFVISPTDYISKFWEKLVGTECVFPEYNDDWVMKLFDKMKTANEGIDKKSPNFKNVLIILDDCFDGYTRGHDKEMRSLSKIASQGRHWGVSCCCIVQYFTSLSPLQRNNASYIFYGKNNKASNELLESQFNLGLSSKEFLKMIDDCTDNHNFLIINNEASNTSNLDSVYGKIKVPNNRIY
jgi:hypothetical protein